MTPLARAVAALAAGRPLGEALTADAFREVMRGEGSPTLIAALLMGLRVRGEDVDVIVGAVRALREAMVRVPVSDRARLVDTCGTGGGAVRTFNVSTAAALVATGAGARVAKHGNRSYTSQCGSADVLEALGVAISTDAATAARLLHEVGMAFLFAPAFHPAMRHVAPIRRDLGVPTIMNVLGPLANPAGVTRQLIGVADRELAPLLASVLARLDATHAIVVCADAGMDEIAPLGVTRAWEVRGGEVRAFAIDAAALGHAVPDVTALDGAEPADNAGRIRRLMEQPDDDPAGRAVVALNAGAACYVAGVAASLEEGVERALDALRSGAGADVLTRLVDASRGLNTAG